MPVASAPTRSEPNKHGANEHEHTKNTVTVTFTVAPDTDEHLQSEHAIRDEFQSWLEGLNAVVQTVDVRAATTIPEDRL